jgi:hypothetical protein
VHVPVPAGEQLSPSRYGSNSYTQQHAVRAQQQQPPPPLGGTAPLQQPSLITQFGASSLKGPLGATAQQQLQHHQQQQQQSQLSPPRLRPGALSAPSSAASTPAAASASSPRLEGKEFFRQARAQLSYEQFSAFLGSIKELNAGRATREETLQTARELFGVANSHLYGEWLAFGRLQPWGSEGAIWACSERAGTAGRKIAAAAQQATAHCTLRCALQSCCLYGIKHRR